jgi:hypothetical protein
MNHRKGLGEVTRAHRRSPSAVRRSTRRRSRGVKRSAGQGRLANPRGSNDGADVACSATVETVRRMVMTTPGEGIGETLADQTSRHTSHGAFRLAAGCPMKQARQRAAEPAESSCCAGRRGGRVDRDCHSQARSSGGDRAAAEGSEGRQDQDGGDAEEGDG